MSVYYDPFTDLIFAVIFAYALWLFHSIIKNTILVYAAKEKYVALYDLKKLEGDLKSRKLSFEELDSFGLQFVKSDKASRNRLKEIDDDYGIEPVFDSKKAK